MAKGPANELQGDVDGSRRPETRLTGGRDKPGEEAQDGTDEYENK